MKLFILICTLVVLTATENGDSGKSYILNLDKPLPYGSKFVEVRDGTMPPLMEFILNSDYVVMASASAVVPVGKRGVNPLRADASEMVAGILYTINIENVLFSKKAFDGSILPVPVQKLEILTDARSLNEFILLNGTRYLLFLAEIPKNDKVFTLLELDKDKTYYSGYVGTTTIFPVTGRSVHGYNQNGLIDLSSGKYPDVVNNIKQLCVALRPDDRATRINNLRNLAKSGDDVLRDNALYALNYLSN